MGWGRHHWPPQKERKSESHQKYAADQLNRIAVSEHPIGNCRDAECADRSQNAIAEDRTKTGRQASQNPFAMAR